MSLTRTVSGDPWAHRALTISAVAMRCSIGASYEGTDSDWPAFRRRHLEAHAVLLFGDCRPFQQPRPEWPEPWTTFSLRESSSLNDALDTSSRALQRSLPRSSVARRGVAYR